MKLDKKKIELGILLEKEGRLVFQKDRLLGSPSMAAIPVMGRNANGWMERKDKSGKTLDELKRQESE